MFPKDEIIHIGCWNKLCDMHFEDQTDIPSGLIHCHLEDIPRLFSIIDNNQKSKYVIVSSDSDAGLHYQSKHHPSQDFYRTCFMYVTEEQGYKDLFMDARLKRENCRETDKYSIKYYSYTQATFNYIPKNVVHWYVVNCAIENDRVTPIPMGVHGQEAIDKISEYKDKKKDYLLYVNFEPFTMERVQLIPYFDKFHWATVERKVDFDTYLNRFATHAYVLAPPGNGYETYRLWEAIYMNTIPIVEDRIYTQYLYKHSMPVLFTPSFFALSKEKLVELYNSRIYSTLNKDVAYFSYWKEKIGESRKLCQK